MKAVVLNEEGEVLDDKEIKDLEIKEIKPDEIKNEVFKYYDDDGNVII
jgi:hypothetical protein